MSNHSKIYKKILFWETVVLGLIISFPWWCLLYLITTNQLNQLTTKGLALLEFLGIIDLLIAWPVVGSLWLNWLNQNLEEEKTETGQSAEPIDLFL